MVIRALLFVGFFALALGFGLNARKSRTDHSVAGSSLIALLIADMRPERRIAITVVNIGSSNIELIESMDHAENMGDADVAFERNGREFRRQKRPSQLISDVVGWYPGGNGFTRARSKAEYVAALGLDAGCYRMAVTFSNTAAQGARLSGQAGPITPPAQQFAAVCFDEIDVSRGRELAERGGPVDAPN